MKFELVTRCPPLEKIENANTEVVEQIREKIESGQFEYSQHATDQSIRRQISVTELRDAMRAPELVEDYPNAKYGPSCLLLGFTNSGRPLHVKEALIKSELPRGTRMCRRIR